MKHSLICVAHLDCTLLCLLELRLIVRRRHRIVRGLRLVRYGRLQPSGENRAPQCAEPREGTGGRVGSPGSVWSRLARRFERAAAARRLEGHTSAARL